MAQRVYFTEFTIKTAIKEDASESIPAHSISTPALPLAPPTRSGFGFPFDDSFQSQVLFQRGRGARGTAAA